MTVRAVRDALLSHGWEGDAADAASAGLESWTHHLNGLTPEQIESLLRAAPRFGVDLLTGPDWAVLSGTRARLSSLARSWSLPPELYDLVVSIGTALPADPAAQWRAGETVFDLSKPVVFERLPPNVERVTGIMSSRAAGEVSSRSAADVSSRTEGDGASRAAGEVSSRSAADVSSRTEGDVSSRAGGEGSRTGALLITARSAETAMQDITSALDQALTLGVDSETIAIDPGWSPPLDRFRRFGRPIVCTTDDPVRAVLARVDGAQIFLTSAPDLVRRALEILEHA